LPLKELISRTLLRASFALNKAGYRLYTNDRASAGPDEALSEYVMGMPSAQNAINALPGWNHALPDAAGVTAGIGSLHDDPRIAWALEQFGSIEGKRILELGPLEAAHTALIDRQAPGILHSIEANKLSFLRCLIVKEILNFKHARFFLGDFVPWLEKPPTRYDFIIASGVLYHMQDPVHLLKLISANTDSFYIWTHYYDRAAMPVDDLRHTPFVGDPEIQTVNGISAHLHTRSYHGAWQSKSFCGGIHDLHRWIAKNDIIDLIRSFGFDDVRTAHDEPNHQNGPSFSIFARRSLPDGIAVANSSSQSQ
jgi:hypothetical protein